MNFAVRLAFLTISASPALAMDFTLSDDPSGISVVMGRGPIISGDADRLFTVLKQAPSHPVLGKVLSLDSLGGDVAAAFSMVAVMDQVGVTTLVGVGAECLSACASVLFVSGTYRLALEGGYLGMHHCYKPDGGLAPYCNAAMAENALNHGVPYGSIMSFVSYTRPEHILWFSAADAECYGLTRWPDDDPLEIPPCVRAVLMGEPSPLAEPNLGSQ